MGPIQGTPQTMTDRQGNPIKLYEDEQERYLSAVWIAQNPRAYAKHSVTLSKILVEAYETLGRLRQSLEVE